MKRKGEKIDGWLVLDKPAGITSTHAVSKVKRLTKAAKIGHGGTLDPFATGVLPLALGEATKTMPYVLDGDKSYEFTIQWGSTTDSLDCDGQVVKSSDVRPTSDQIAAALPIFVGEISQVPPIFSAIHVDGQRAYDLARAGETPELKARLVTIRQLALIEDNPQKGTTKLHVACGKGTYVRSICRDLAQHLGAEAHVVQLRRIHSGPFHLEQAISLESLEGFCHKGALEQVLRPITTALDDIPALPIDGPQALRLKNGLPLTAVLPPSQVMGSSNVALALKDGIAVALVSLDGDQWRPFKVFNL